MGDRLDALAGGSDVLDTERAFAAVLRSPGAFQEPRMLLDAACEAYAATAASVVASPAGAERCSVLERCGVSIEGLALRAFAALEKQRSRAHLAATGELASLCTLLQEADVAYSGMCSALARVHAGCDAPAAAEASAAGRAYATALRRRGDLARYAAERGAGRTDAGELYAAALNVWPSDGHTRNLSAVAFLSRGEELCAAHSFLRALASRRPFPAARGNALPLLVAASSRTLSRRGEDAEGDADAVARVAETAVLAALAPLLASPARRAQALASSAAALAAFRALGPCPAAAARCLASAVAVAHSLSEHQAAALALTLCAGLASAAFQAAATPGAQLGAATSLACDWLASCHAQLSASLPRASMLILQASLADLLNCPAVRALAEAGRGRPQLTQEALPDDWEMRGFAPLRHAHALRLFHGEPCEEAHVARAQRLVWLGAWAATPRVGVLSYSHVTGRYSPFGDDNAASRQMASLGLTPTDGDVGETREEEEEELGEAAAAALQSRRSRHAPLRRVPSAGDFLHASSCGPRRIILDVLNVGRRFALGKRFSVHGAAIAVHFWRARGHRVTAFIPVFYLRGGGSGEGRHPVEDAAQLQAWVSEGLLVPTPAGDYDDLYCYQHARTTGAYIVSNDRFADLLERERDQERQETERWLRAHTISFAFVDDAFLPNPGFQFEAEVGAEG